MPSQQASQAQASNKPYLRDTASEETLVDSSKTMSKKLSKTGLSSLPSGEKTKASHKKPKADPIKSWEARVFAALSR